MRIKSPEKNVQSVFLKTVDTFNLYVYVSSPHISTVCVALRPV